MISTKLCCFEEEKKKKRLECCQRKRSSLMGGAASACRRQNFEVGHLRGPAVCHARCATDGGTDVGI